MIINLIYITIFFEQTGGTADIMTLLRAEDGTLQEMGPATGGPWGGNNVNDEFLEFITEVCGREMMHQFKNEHIDDYISLFSRDFEVKKRSVIIDDKIFITLPYALTQLFKNSKGVRTISDAIQKSRFAAEGVTYNSNKLKITGNMFKKFFSATSQSIVQLIKESLNEYPEVDVVLMVGGFSNSTEVYTSVKEEFVGTKVVVPADAELSVLKGAVLLGHNPYNSIG